MTDATETAMPGPEPMKVRDLLAILADCDPDAVVTLYVPGFATESDKTLTDDPDAFAGGFGYTPEISASFMTSATVPYERFFNEDGTKRPGAMANSVEIALSERDTERLETMRRKAIEWAKEDAGEDSDMEPEPIVSDAGSVIVDVRIPRELHASIRQVLRGVNTSHQVKTEQACTHGLLTVAGVLEMFAEDLGMVETRPGCWEASNMAQVLASHGYNH